MSVRKVYTSFAFGGAEMQYTAFYQSPLGKLLLAEDEIGLCGVWFEGQKHYANGLEKAQEERETPLLKKTKEWLDLYFSGREPGIQLKLHLVGTVFQREVWESMLRIPYGQVMTYGEIAAKIAAKRNVPHMSAQAVGAAVGRNKLSIIVPCHRVIGAGGSLTGYAGGLERKAGLLRLEHVDIEPHRLLVK